VALVVLELVVQGAQAVVAGTGEVFAVTVAQEILRLWPEKCLLVLDDVMATAATLGRITRMSR
jgi:hypothetical protein